jgi:hypothetical protein
VSLFYHVQSILLYIMVHPLSRSKQESIRLLLKKGLPCSETMKRVPGASRSTLSKYKSLYAPKRTRGHAGRKITISSTTKNYLKRELINGSLQTAKSVCSYLQWVKKWFQCFRLANLTLYNF